MSQNILSQTDFRYYVFSPKAWLEKQHPEQVQQAFQTWWNVWSEVYKGSNFELRAEEFTRHDLICAVIAGNEAAAVHCYSFFELDSKLDMSTKYFKFFSPFFVNTLKEKNVNRVMSMEYMTVHEKFRSRQIGFSLGRVLAQLGVRLFEQSEGHAIVAPARKDLNVHEMCYDSGFNCIEADISQRSFSCDMIAYFKGNQKNVSDPFLAKICDRLWENKEISDTVNRHVTLPSSVRLRKVV